jgi:hypothetical protein
MAGFRRPVSRWRRRDVGGRRDPRDVVGRTAGGDRVEEARERGLALADDAVVDVERDSQPCGSTEKPEPPSTIGAVVQRRTVSTRRLHLVEEVLRRRPEAVVEVPDAERDDVVLLRAEAPRGGAARRRPGTSCRSGRRRGRRRAPRPPRRGRRRGSRGKGDFSRLVATRSTRMARSPRRSRVLDMRRARRSVNRSGGERGLQPTRPADSPCRACSGRRLPRHDARLARWLADGGRRLRRRTAPRGVPPSRCDAADVAGDAPRALCGTGRRSPTPHRAGPCTAVVAGGRLFLVDVGPGGWKGADLAGCRSTGCTPCC